MKYLKILGLAAVTAAALSALAANTASATTIEVGGVTKNSKVTVAASLAAGNSWTLSRTDGTLGNTCTASAFEATTSTFTGTKVTGALDELSWSNCSAGNPTVHLKGQLYIEHEAGTTNGRVFSENAEVTFPTSFGFTVNCKTGAGTEIGTLTGVASGNATLNINGVVNCGFLLASGVWKGTYTVTSSGLGVSP